MSVSSVSAASASASMQIASGNRIPSAATDAAGQAIASRLESQVSGNTQGAANTADMRNLVNTAEGGMSAISENLQRLNELSLQAQNGLLTNQDRAIIQNEVSQILQSIESISQQTQWGGRNLLDGQAQNLNTASFPDGTGPQVSIPEMSLASLGLEGFDVTSAGFDPGAVSNAMDTVAAARAGLGATANAMGSIISNNETAAINQAAARSRIADTDIARASTELSQEQAAQQYQIYAQERAQEGQLQTLRLFNA